jgi:hypothetical protein
MILLEEWNSSAVAVVLVLVFIPLLLLHFIVYKSLRYFDGSNRLISRLFARGPVARVLFHVLLFALCALLLFLLSQNL